MDDDSEATVHAHLGVTAETLFGADGAWRLESDPTAIRLPDRRLVVRRRDGPEGADHWTLTLLADGETVSKFGPFESVRAMADRARTLLDGDVDYTVCCDG